MLMPGTILQNRYRIVRQLGQGGMGTVYEAVDGRLDTVVAVKETHAAGERLLKQFEREAQLLARLQHPALPRVSDHFTEGDGQFLIMQFIAGADLGELIESRGAGFPVSEVLRWGDELLDALDYLHTQRPPVIHRDIKPQNLKLSERGRIILLDFGLAKGLPPGQTPPPPHEEEASALKSILGYTPNYAPLEQIHGEGTDAKSDLYSLAATLYHLLTGTMPPGSLKRVTALSNGEADPLIPAHRLDSRVPERVSAVLNLALAIARNHRPADAAEMRRALQAAGTDLQLDRDEAGGEASTILLETTITDEPSPPDLSTRLLDSPPAAVVAAPAKQAPPPPTTKTQPSFNRLWLISGLTVLLITAAVVAYKFSGGLPQLVGAGETPTTTTAARAADQNSAAQPTASSAQSEAEERTRAEAGQQLFQSLDCVKCHGNKGEGQIGPALVGLLGDEVRLNNEATITADESYIRESILVPNARVVAGYKTIMPSFRSKLSDEQVAQLVAYIVSLNEKNDPAR